MPTTSTFQHSVMPHQANASPHTFILVLTMYFNMHQHTLKKLNCDLLFGKKKKKSHRRLNSVLAKKPILNDSALLVDLAQQKSYSRNLSAMDCGLVLRDRKIKNNFICNSTLIFPHKQHSCCLKMFGKPHTAKILEQKNRNATLKCPHRLAMAPSIMEGPAKAYIIPYP